jgi:hypothetical protein
VTSLQSGADRLETEHPVEVGGALQVDRQAVDSHAAAGGLCCELPGHARTQCRQHRLEGCCARVMAEQLRWMITTQREVPVHDLAQLLDLASAYVQAEPAIPDRPAAPGQQARLGLFLNHGYRLGHSVYIPAVECRCHECLLCLCCFHDDFTLGLVATMGKCQNRQQGSVCDIDRE